MSVWRGVRLVVEAVLILLVLITGVNWALFALHASWWTHAVAGALIGFSVNFIYLRWRVTSVLKNRLIDDVLPAQIWVDTGDPFDPRGDGTLQPGDPLFDNVMAPLMKGQFPDGVVVISMDGIHEVHTPPKGFQLPPDFNN